MVAIQPFLCVIRMPKRVAFNALVAAPAVHCIDHSILLSILEHRFCIRGLALDCFKSYFSDRTQTFMHADQTTCSFPVNISVTQRSMFGQLGFGAYTEDVADVINRHSVLFQLYADE